MRHRRPSPAEMQRQVELFNHGIKEGDSVTYRRDTGELLRTRTRSAAFILSGHTPVVFVQDVSGCVLLDRVSAAPAASPEPDQSSTVRPMTYTSDQVAEFQAFAHECFKGPADIHINEDGMHAESPGDITRSYILWPGECRLNRVSAAPAASTEPDDLARGGS